MKTLYIDPSKGGISGEALIAALADLGGNADLLSPLVKTVAAVSGSDDFSFSIEKTQTGMNGNIIPMKSGEPPIHAGRSTRQVLEEVLAEIRPDERTFTLARAVLAELEAAADITAPGPPHSPLSRGETVFTILGPLIMLESLIPAECPVLSAPPALGFGEKTATSAVALEILIRNQIPYIPCQAREAGTTPVGVALLAELADVGERFSAMTPVRAGYGTVRNESSGDAGLLAVVEGEVSDLIEDRVVILETNLDDISGEVIGYTMERLFAAGAVDVFLIPAQGKKNRPVQMLSVITSRSGYQQHLRILMEETGTLGVRVREVPRLVADREKIPVPVSVCGRDYIVRVKTSKAYGRVIAIKPEYEDLRIISRELNLPLRYVTEEVRKQVSRGVFPGDSRCPEA
jgi:uncharacterized protein (DUF111 family)